LHAVSPRATSMEKKTDDSAGSQEPGITALEEKHDSIAATKNKSSEFSSPTKLCIRRIQIELKSIGREPIDGIFVEPDETRVNVCHGLIIGPSDTPYEFGFFYFLLEFPNDYPHSPPRVTLQTTGGGAVRFNPNLYKCGKVCLSILGTWSGPSWSPNQTIRSVLLSIRSLMNSSPYHNEPGFEAVVSPSKSKNYNHCIRHETLRIAVLDMVDLAKSKNLPDGVASMVRNCFIDFAEVYKKACDEYSFLDGRKFQDPHHNNTGTFNFSRLRGRIEQMEETVMELVRPLPSSSALPTT